MQCALFHSARQCPVLVRSCCICHPFRCTNQCCKGKTLAAKLSDHGFQMLLSGALILQLLQLLVIICHCKPSFALSNEPICMQKRPHISVRPQEWLYVSLSCFRADLFDHALNAQHFCVLRMILDRLQKPNRQDSFFDAQKYHLFCSRSV